MSIILHSRVRWLALVGHWVSSHFGVSGNDRADVLTVAPHLDEEAVICFYHFTEARCRSSRALLHRLCANCAFTQDALCRLGRVSAPDYCLPILVVPGSG